MSLKRIIMHWSAGGHSVSALDRKHYHYIVSGDGNAVAGLFAPESNIKPISKKYAAHTLNCNTGSIGVAMAAMAGAVERPFNCGKSGITEIQVAKFVELVAALSCKYGIPVTRKTVLTHAEVQPALGIKQRGKWDICWLPGMKESGDPVKVGDELRKRIIAAGGKA